MRNLGVLAGQIDGEYLESDVEDAWKRTEQIARNIVLVLDHRHSPPRPCKWLPHLTRRRHGITA
jgi:hypothetical protein